MGKFSKKALKTFIHRRYRTHGSLLKEFGYSSECAKVLKELLKEGQIKFTWVYLKGWRYIYSRPDFDTREVGGEEKELGTKKVREEIKRRKEEEK